MVSRLALIGVVNVVLASATIGIAYQETKQFYPTCIQLTKHNGSMLVLCIP